MAFFGHARRRAACVFVTVSWMSFGASMQAEAAPRWTLAWQSGFERGFPGEFHPWDNGSYTASGVMPSGRTSAWTIVSRSSGAPVRSGDRAYRGWVTGPSSSSHRPYPGLMTGDGGVTPPAIPSPIVNTFWVWLDADYASLSPTDWISFGTWGNNPEWIVHTLSVRDRRLEFAHTVPFGGQYIGPQPQPTFPLRRWVRITAYIEYNGPTGFVQVWQDGVPMLRGDWTQRPGTTLRRAHWGLYANGAVRRANLYNDDISVWTLSERLGDLSREPQPPQSQPSGGCGAGSETGVAATGAVAVAQQMRRRRRSAAGGTSEPQPTS